MEQSTNPRMLVVAGSYERVLLGYEFIGKEKEKPTPKFMTAGHENSVRAIQVHEMDGKMLLVSSSNDETLKIYSLEKQIELGSILQKNGVVHCLGFFGEKKKTAFMFGGCEDGTINIWSLENFALVYTLIGHKSPLIDFFVHPSGKMALSIAKNNEFRMWNLATAKSVFSAKFPTESNSILKWIEREGDSLFIITYGHQINLYSGASGELVATISTSSKVVSLTVIQTHFILIGSENKSINLYYVPSNPNNEDKAPTLIHTAEEAHKVRVKGICAQLISSQDTTFTYWVASGSSDGEMRLWSMTLEDKGAASKVSWTGPLQSVLTKARITCMTSTLM